MGEPSKVILLEKVVEIIKRDKLIENVRVTGSFFFVFVFCLMGRQYLNLFVNNEK